MCGTQNPSMTIGELKEILEKYDDNLEVLITSESLDIDNTEENYVFNIEDAKFIEVDPDENGNNLSYINLEAKVIFP